MTRNGGDRLPRLYRDIADWYPLLTPVGDYVAEAAFYLHLFRSHGSRPPRSLLDLGSGGGHNAFHRTAFEHTAPGGVALFQPDFVRETFEEGTEQGGVSEGSRGLRYLEWRWRRPDDDETYLTDMAYLLRDESGAVEVIHDRHVMGLFPRAEWLERIAGAGFRATAVPFEIGVKLGVAHEVFVGVRPDAVG